MKVFIYLILILLSVSVSAGGYEANRVSQSSVEKQQCFIGDNKYRCSLRDNNDAGSSATAEPASIAYTINNNGSDSYSVKAAFELERRFGADDEAALSFETLWHRNNQQQNEQNNFNIGIGGFYQFNTVSKGYDTWDGESAPDAYTVIEIDGSIVYNRRELFADMEEQDCDDPVNTMACNNNFLETVRASFDVAPFSSLFETGGGILLATGGYAPRISVSPVLSVFHDKVINSPINPVTSQAVDGSVTGIKTAISAAYNIDENFKLRVDGQYIQTLRRDTLRRSDFPGSSFLLGISLDYALGFIPIDQGSSFKPSIGIKYTEGEDPLLGLVDQSTIELAFKLSY